MIQSRTDKMMAIKKWYKCGRCGAKLFFGSSAHIEIKCKKCGHVNKFNDGVGVRLK